ncbi:response regulator transcription factor, partial [Akkermansiaceae bacterium]|nr:response regulator transcription factor [Akkermansiaceae bacterium]
YLIKPFSFEELLVRLETVIRTAQGTIGTKSVLEAGHLKLDPWKREVIAGDEPLILHAREFALMELLMRNTGLMVSKTMILEDIYGYSFDPQSGVVDVLVHRLRKKLKEHPKMPNIRTRRNMGYLLEIAS